MRVALAVMVMGAVVWCLPAMAGPGIQDDVSRPDWWSLSLGLYDMGDDGTGLGVGAQYGFPVGRDELVVGLSWGDGEFDYLTDAGIRSLSEDVWALDLSYVATVKQEGAKLFYGAGIGLYEVKGRTESDNSFGGHVLLGALFADDWFAELRYVFGTEFDWAEGFSTDVDGLRFSVGKRF